MFVVVLALALGGCTSPASAPPSPSPVATSNNPTPVAPTTTTTSRPTPTPTTQPTKKPMPPHPISMDALIQKKYDGRNLKLGRRVGDFGAYRRYLVSFRGDGLRISGVMNVPDGKGPFPVLVLNHGYIDRDTYFPGQGMPRTWSPHTPAERGRRVASIKRTVAFFDKHLD